MIHRLASIPSTNDEAKRLARLGAAHGEVVIADAQTAGKGRRGRSWASPSVENLYLSVILRLDLAPKEAPRLVSVVSVAVAEALRSLGAGATIKWPNDVEVEGKKIAGILTELSADRERIHFVVMGIGVNLNAVLSDFPEEVRERATTLLLETGERVSRDRVAAQILERLEHWLGRFLQEGFAPVRLRYMECSAILGRSVRLLEPERVVEGIAEDVDEDGALLVRMEDGAVERFLTGDITSLRRV